MIPSQAPPGKKAPAMPSRVGMLVVVAAACGGSFACDVTRAPGEPAITELRFAGQAEDSPLVLLLEGDFVDEDGDLSEGHLETFINQRATSAGRLPLLPIFLRSDLEDDATSGTLEFVLELAFADQPPAAGTSFSLGARLMDGAGHASTLKEVRLTLEDGE